MPEFKNGKWYDNYGKEITPANERGAAMSPSTSATPSWYKPPVSPVARPPMQPTQYGQPPSTPSWGGNWLPKPSRQTDTSLLSGLNGGMKSADREPLGGATGDWDLSKFRALAPGSKSPGSASKPAAPAPAPAALPVNPFAPSMDTRDPGVSAYDTTVGPENPAWYSGPNAGQYSGSRMEAGTDFGFGTPGPEDPSWYAEQGKKAPRPDRGFLQSLSDGIGDAVTNVGQYVQDTPNLLQLGINMMAAANAPSKAEQWQQFAGSFDKFGQANRVDEDRKLSKQDREREIERQKKADAQTAEMHARQIGSLDRETKEAERVEQEREATKQVVTGMLKELPADANPVMRNLLEFASIGGNYAPVLEYQIRAAEKAGDREHAEQLARLQGNISLQVARMQADREDKRQDNQFNKVLAGEEAKQAGASGLKMPELEDALKNIDDALALLDKGRGMKTGSVFDPSMTLRYTFGDKQGADLMAALNSNTANRTLAILAAQAGVASESDAQRAGFAAVDPQTMSFDAARERLLKMREYTVEDMARMEAQQVWREDVGSVGQAFMTLPDGRRVSFNQHFKENYKPPAPPPSAVRELVYTKEEMGSTPNARITSAIKGLQGALTPQEYDSAVAALKNMPKDELATAMAQAPRTRVSTNFAMNTIR